MKKILAHPATGGTITLDDEKDARAHLDAGWVDVTPAKPKAQPKPKAAESKPAESEKPKS